MHITCRGEDSILDTAAIRTTPVSLLTTDDYFSVSLLCLLETISYVAQASLYLCLSCLSLPLCLASYCTILQAAEAGF